MILNNEREKTIYQQGYMSGCNAAQAEIKVAERRAELAEAFHDLKCKDYDLLNYQFEKIKHRADVAERAVREFAVNVWCVNCPYKGRCSVSNPSAENDYQECYDEILKIAEKDLAEEKKYDRKRKNN